MVRARCRSASIHDDRGPSPHPARTSPSHRIDATSPLLAVSLTLTVAFAAILKSSIEFSNLTKQVEAYNAALRDLHNLMNDWEAKTRTERRTTGSMHP